VILLNEPIFDLIGPDLEVVEPDRIEMESAMEGSFVETDDCGIIDFLFSRRSIADRFILKVPCRRGCEKDTKRVNISST
jgi:hypothetical protein